MIVYLTAVVAFFATLGVVFSAVGWRHSLFVWDRTEADWWFSLAKVLYAFAIGLRIFVWDIIWWPLQVHDSEKALIIIGSIQALKVNLATVTLVAFGAYCSLKARHMLIPEPERSRWRWWNAWVHPHIHVGWPWRGRP